MVCHLRLNKSEPAKFTARGPNFYAIVDRYMAPPFPSPEISRHDYLSKKIQPGLQITRWEGGRFSEKDSIIDSNLTFRWHMTEKVNKSSTVMWVIRITYTYLDESTFLSL